jgi:hypothetical protein
VTEAEWLACADGSALWHHLIQGGVSARKERLYAVACCRRVEHLLPAAAAAHLRLIEACERFADGLATADDLRAAADAAGAVSDASGAGQTPEERAGGAGALHAHAAAGLGPELDPDLKYTAAAAVASFRSGPVPAGDPSSEEYTRTEEYRRHQARFLECWDDELAAQAGLVRDLFGNPFRPVAFDPAWRSPTAVVLAQAMYDGRDFAAMPVLADALQDAGCEQQDVLGHCRGGGEHVRGCWVVDHVLGRG